MIKIIALITMVIDHLGIFIFPQHEIVLRSIGSISFPLFAWMIIEGRYHTGDLKKYLNRLLIFAIISQPIYMLMFPHNEQYNAIFSLFWGLLLICLYERWGWFIFLGIVPLLHFQVVTCYVLLMFLFYFFRGKQFPILIGSAAFFLFVSTWAPDYHLWGLLFLPLIFIDPLHFKLPVNKYVFYSFYPVHFLIIWGILQWF